MHFMLQSFTDTWGGAFTQAARIHSYRRTGYIKISTKGEDVMATGVYTAYKKDGTEYYRVSLTCQNKHISLGSFDDYKTAAAVYSEANAIVRDEKSSHFVNAAEKITSYSSCTSALAFEKFMILLNLRDNNIYIKTPVYLCDKYFLYFFSPEIVLTFDIEDLFYYSGHKIMSRGGYFFVNDFGMQTSILARFGIRSHSVKGKDYLFRNGDEHDFRYSNVAVVNRYNGVEQIEKNGRILYRTRIHINGNYTIGTYTSENEAAIAYNRAIDLLAKQLPDFKNYTRNYIEGLSHIEYASIYNTVKISRSFRHYIEQLGLTY